jgi:hypothetical protein
MTELKKSVEEARDGDIVKVDGKLCKVSKPTPVAGQKEASGPELIPLMEKDGKLD